MLYYSRSGKVSIIPDDYTKYDGYLVSLPIRNYAPLSIIVHYTSPPITAKG